MLHCFLEPGMAARDPLYAFVPLALAGFTTAVILGVQWCVGLFFNHDQGFQKHQSISKGANQ
jgi:hypothetical protein